MTAIADVRGTCFRSFRNREGSFSRYKKMEAEVVGYTTYDGCPGGNVEYAVDEWNDPEWKNIIQPTLMDEETRLSYN